MTYNPYASEDAPYAFNYEDDTYRLWQERLWRKLAEDNVYHGETPCPICKGNGFITTNTPVGHPMFGRAFKCLCWKYAHDQTMTDAILGDAAQAVPVQGRALTFEHFQNYPFAQDALEAARVIARGEPLEDRHGIARCGLYLHGNTGSGKSTLAYLILREYLQRYANAAWLTYLPFIARIQATYDNSYRGPRQEEILKTVSEAPFLVIDDLCAGRFEQTANRADIFFQVFDKRMTLQLPTVITSNLELEAIGRAFNDMNRIRSRIAGLCHVIPMAGVDFRTGEGLQERVRK